MTSCSNQATFWESMKSKYEKRNESLKQQELLLRERLEQLKKVMEIKRIDTDICDCVPEKLEKTNIVQTLVEKGKNFLLGTCKCDAKNPNDNFLCACDVASDDVEFLDNFCPNLQQNEEKIVEEEGCLNTTCDFYNPNLTLPPIRENPSTFSLKSCDLHYMKNLTELVKNEEEMREKIEDLERRERSYICAIQEIDEAIKRKPKTPKNECASLIEEENKKLKHQLEDLKLELKHCFERVEGPLKRNLDDQKEKCLKMEQELKEFQKIMANKEDNYLKEINEIKAKLCHACCTMVDLNSVNSKLKIDLATLQDRCENLEEDLIKQQFKEAENILKFKQALERRQVEKNRGDDSEQNLENIARKLSETLKEVCPCVQDVQEEKLIETVLNIKKLTDLVNMKKEGKTPKFEEESVKLERSISSPKIEMVLQELIEIATESSETPKQNGSPKRRSRDGSFNTPGDENRRESLLSNKIKESGTPPKSETPEGVPSPGDENRRGSLQSSHNEVLSPRPGSGDDLPPSVPPDELLSPKQEDKSEVDIMNQNHSAKIGPSEEVIAVKNLGTLSKDRTLTENDKFKIETTRDVIDVPTEDVQVVTTIAETGSLEITTEGPPGVIVTNINYLDDGRVEIITKLIDHSKSGKSRDGTFIHTGRDQRRNVKVERDVNSGAGRKGNITEDTFSKSVDGGENTKGNTLSKDFPGKVVINNFIVLNGSDMKNPLKFIEEKKKQQIKDIVNLNEKKSSNSMKKISGENEEFSAEIGEGKKKTETQKVDSDEDERTLDELEETVCQKTEELEEVPMSTSENVTEKMLEYVETSLEEEDENTLIENSLEDLEESIQEGEEQQETRNSLDQLEDSSDSEEDSVFDSKVDLTVRGEVKGDSEISEDVTSTMEGIIETSEIREFIENPDEEEIERIKEPGDNQNLEDKSHSECSLDSDSEELDSKDEFPSSENLAGENGNVEYQFEENVTELPREPPNSTSQSQDRPLKKSSTDVQELVKFEEMNVSSTETIISFENRKTSHVSVEIKSSALLIQEGLLTDITSFHKLYRNYGNVNLLKNLHLKQSKSMNEKKNLANRIDSLRLSKSLTYPEGELKIDVKKLKFPFEFGDSHELKTRKKQKSVSNKKIKDILLEEMGFNELRVPQQNIQCYICGCSKNVDKGEENSKSPPKNENLEERIDRLLEMNPLNSKPQTSKAKCKSSCKGKVRQEKLGKHDPNCTCVDCICDPCNFKKTPKKAKMSHGASINSKTFRYPNEVTVFNVNIPSCDCGTVCECTPCLDQSRAAGSGGNTGKLARSPHCKCVRKGSENFTFDAAKNTPSKRKEMTANVVAFQSRTDSSTQPTTSKIPETWRNVNGRCGTMEREEKKYVCDCKPCECKPCGYADKARKPCDCSPAGRRDKNFEVEPTLHPSDSDITFTPVDSVKITPKSCNCHPCECAFCSDPNVKPNKRESIKPDILPKTSIEPGKEVFDIISLITNQTCTVCTPCQCDPCEDVQLAMKDESSGVDDKPKDTKQIESCHKIEDVAVKQEEKEEEEKEKEEEKVKEEEKEKEEDIYDEDTQMKKMRCVCSPCTCNPCRKLMDESNEPVPVKKELEEPVPVKEELPLFGFSPDSMKCECSPCKCLYCSRAKKGVGIVGEDEELPSDRGDQSETAIIKEELAEVLEKISSTCEKVENNLEPVVRKATNFEMTVSKMKLRLNNLQEKCRDKDQIINAMTEELALRSRSGVFGNLLENLAHPREEKVPDFNRKFVCDYLPRPRLNKRHYWPCKLEPILELDRYLPEENNNNYENQCKCKIPDVSNLEIIDVRRVTIDSLLVKWCTPKSISSITGYQIYVNNILKYKVLSPNRTNAVLDSLDLKDSIEIVLYAMSYRGRCEPPALATYQI